MLEKFIKRIVVRAVGHLNFKFVQIAQIMRISKINSQNKRIGGKLRQEFHTAFGNASVKQRQREDILVRVLLNLDRLLYRHPECVDG